MCGILGYVGHRESTQVLLDGLKKLEYRGYDSAGVAVQSDSDFQIRRSVGKLGELETLLSKKPASGHVGLGHTRWATHGAPSENNAHPHLDNSGRIVVVHNGIIENYQPLKAKLIEKGVKFHSDTDTEVVAHLIASHWDAQPKNGSTEPKTKLLHAVAQALKEIRGTFALGIMCTSVPGVVIGARRDCPLIVGLGEKEHFLASDVPAILSYTRSVVFLEDGDLVVLEANSVEYFDVNEKPITRKTSTVSWNPVQAEKAGYKHFMLKEIHEQPRIIEDTLRGRIVDGNVILDSTTITEREAQAFSRVRFIACGTSWHASLVGSYLIEKYAGIPCGVDIASEFRYRDPIIEPNTLMVAISQSGETADTLAAARLAKSKGAKVLTISNVVGSSLTREVDGLLMTHCGPEMGVASTKAFMGQLVALHLLTLYLAGARGYTEKSKLQAHIQDLTHLSQVVTQTMECEQQVIDIAKQYFRRKDFLYLGRNVNYPVALEGALKLKEISYIHAEGYPAGEMKHGPIALIDENMPIVAIVTKSKVYEKMLSNIEEARSRGADVIAIATKGDTQVKEKAAQVIYVPEVPEDLSPLINVIPLQMLAYQIAVFLGCDVDQPRNLAKSVTVE
jgi:glucosamine--fructose-6-phosphate aminotransferase (isomerizing)